MKLKIFASNSSRRSTPQITPGVGISLSVNFSGQHTYNWHKIYFSIEFKFHFLLHMEFDCGHHIEFFSKMFDPMMINMVIVLYQTGVDNYELEHMLHLKDFVFHIFEILLFLQKKSLLYLRKEFFFDTLISMTFQTIYCDSIYVTHVTLIINEYAIKSAIMHNIRCFHTNIHL